MNSKKLLAIVMSGVMLAGMSATTVFAEDEAPYAAYTLTIPSGIVTVDLTKDSHTSLGDIKVTPQESGKTFVDEKKVKVTYSSKNYKKLKN